MDQGTNSNEEEHNLQIQKNLICIFSLQDTLEEICLSAKRIYRFNRSQFLLNR